MARGQMSIEFFIIAGFILLASSILIANADTQIQETSALNNIVAGRNAMDLLSTSCMYVYLQGNNSAVTNYMFIPSNTSCFNFNTTFSKFYCVTLGVTGLVFSDALPFNASAQDTGCSAFNATGWLRVSAYNSGGNIIYSCRRV
ncbi:MAG: hypothetical protein V1708_03565 [Candidatus Micrarchaeota archaeon]